MVSMTVKIEKDNTDKVKEVARENLKTALALIGQAAETNAIYEITVLGAVDTGNLRRSIEHGDNGKDEAYVGTNVEYAPYVELGTVKMHARPYLRPAITDHLSEYKQIAINELK